MIMGFCLSSTSHRFACCMEQSAHDCRWFVSFLFFALREEKECITLALTLDRGYSRLPCYCLNFEGCVSTSCQACACTELCLRQPSAKSSSSQCVMTN